MLQWQREAFDTDADVLVLRSQLDAAVILEELSHPPFLSEHRLTDVLGDVDLLAFSLHHTEHLWKS